MKDSLIKFQSPCGQYAGYFEADCMPPDWICCSESNFIKKDDFIGNDEFKDIFCKMNGNALSKLNKTINIFEKHSKDSCSYHQVSFRIDECVSLLEDAIILDLKKESVHNSYSDWENLDDFIKFLETAEELNILLEEKSIHEYLNNNSAIGFGSLMFIKSHDIDEYIEEVKDYDLYCLRNFFNQ